MRHIYLRERRDSDLTILDLSNGSEAGFRKVIFGLALQVLVDTGQNQVILNLARVPRVDAAGLGELVGARNRISESGGQMKMCELRKRVTELISLSGLVPVFEIFENEALATSSFQIRRNRKIVNAPAENRFRFRRDNPSIF